MSWPPLTEDEFRRSAEYEAEFDDWAIGREDRGMSSDRDTFHRTAEYRLAFGDWCHEGELAMMEDADERRGDD